MVLDTVSHVVIFEEVCKVSTISTLERRVRDDNMHFVYPRAVA